MKWDLGWMNDTLKFVERPAIYRKYHSNEITFGMYYNQNEQFTTTFARRSCSWEAFHYREDEWRLRR